VAPTVTLAGSTWNTTAGNKTVTATPAVGDMIVIVCANSGRTTAQAPTVTDNNSSGTYTQVKAATRASSVDAMWVFVRTATIASATSTIFTFAPLGGADTGGGLIVFRVTGTSGTGSGAVAQSGSQDNQASGTPAVTLTDPIRNDQAVIGGVMTGSNLSTNVVAPTTLAFTEDIDAGYNVLPTGQETCHLAGGTGVSTITWGGAAASAFCTVLVVMNGPATVLPPILVTPIGTGSAV